jgi:hypothetical protein
MKSRQSVEHLAGGGGGLAGQLLAHHQRDGLLERRIRLFG